MPGAALANANDLDRGPALLAAGRRVLEIQARLRRWTVSDPHRRFDDLSDLACDPAFLRVGWYRVRGHRGGNTARADRAAASVIEHGTGVDAFLAGLREELRHGRSVRFPSGSG